MPHLIKGHLKFTEDDYVASDYLALVQNELGSKPVDVLTKMLKFESKRLNVLKDNSNVNNTCNVSVTEILSNTLALLTAIADKEGCHLNDLMKFKINNSNK